MRRILGVFLLFVVLGALLAAAGIAVSRSGRAGTRLAGGPVVLTWELDGPLPERPSPAFLPLAVEDRRTSLPELWRSFVAARRDGAVRGLGVWIRDGEFGLGKAQELRRQLAALRAAGKFVDCYLETAGEGRNGTLEYFVATACDAIVMAPPGVLNLLGLYSDSVFLRGALEKLRIEPQFGHVGAYKSAAETWTEREHSAAAEEALGAVLDGEYGAIVAAIAEARGLAPERVRELVDGAPWSAEEALAAGLVDALAYPDQFLDRLADRAGSEPRYRRLASLGDGAGGFGGTRVAVLVAEGTIVRGSGGEAPWTAERFLGSDDLGSALRDLAEDDGVAAVVLRIDSPGGSALASDLILREVERLAARKPVVVSMADVAASGGYYIAAKAGQLVAEAGTITGSIGVVSGKLVTRGLEEQHLGLTRDVLRRGANAGMYSSSEPFSPAQAERHEAMMRRVYDAFVDQVAAGRKMERAAVEAVAEGRIWTGEDARSRGLVDELGGLDRALELACSAAGLDAERVVVELLPRPAGFFELLTGSGASPLPAELRAVLGLLAGRRVHALELPPEARSLARPF